MKELLQNKKVRNTVSTVAFTALGAWALYSIITSDEIDWHEVWIKIKSASPFFVFLIFVDSVFGYYVRAMRWRILMKASGHEVETPTLWWSMMYGYLINLGVPRLGELSRSMSLQEKKGVPFATSFSTILIERLTDVGILLLLVIGVSIWQYDTYHVYIDENLFGTIEEVWAYLKAKPLLLGGIGVGFVAFLYFFFFDKKVEKEVTENKFLNDIEQGLKSFNNIEKPSMYWLYTATIWVSYLMTGYFCFRAVAELNHLGFAAVFALLAYGSIARSLPFQGGGLAVYWKAVSSVLLVGYAIGAEVGLAAGMILWAVQTFMQVLFGVISLPFIYSKDKETPVESEHQ